MVFSSVQLNEKKRTTKKHTVIFLDFFSFSEESKLTKEKQKSEKNYLHGKAPNKQKKKQEIC